MWIVGFSDLGPRGKPPRSKIAKSITRSTLISAVRQTCPTVEDREKHSDAWSVTADFVFRGDQRSACGDIRQSGQLAYFFVYLFI